MRAEGNRDTAALDSFLAGVERRAFRMALFAVGNRDDALDIVQEAMLKLVQRYRHRPAAEWPPLFYRILQSRMRDHLRRERIRRRWRIWFGGSDEQAADPLESLPAPVDADPAIQAQDEGILRAIEAAVQALPLRQQQAFLLRAWEGLDVADTARAMDCSEGSVKTHYARALQSLRRQLEGHHHDR
jgi:RNA polymerase sigma-70 factor (ECF subfamily)